MIALPIGWLISILSLLIAAALGRAPGVPPLARVAFLAYLFALALVGFLVGLRLQFGWAPPFPVQALVAIWLGPAAFLGFHALVHDEATTRQTAIRHLAATGLAASTMFVPSTFGIELILFLAHGYFMVRLVLFLRLERDRFQNVPDAAIALTKLALWAVILLFGLMIAVDGVVTLIILTMGEAWMTQALSGASGIVAIALIIALLIGLPLALSANRGGSEAKPSAASVEDQALLERLDTLLSETGLYRDNGLTLARLARRLGVSAREVSGAVNRVTGENVSRHLNGFRIRHAQSLLAEGELPVTEIMLEVGFLSKSSFNSEFRRITGATPSGYRKQSRA